MKETATEFSDQLITQFLEEVPAAIAMFDRNMNYLFTSRQWLKEVQLPDETSHIGKNLYDTIPNQPEHWIDAHKRGLAGERSAHDLEEVPVGNGDSIWYQWGVSPWFDRNGDIGGVLIYMQNMTQRVIADRLASKINEERMRRQIRVEAGETERRRISRELHDGLGQLLTAAQLNVNLVMEKSDPTTESIQQAMGKIRELLEYSIREIRTIAHELRPSILDDFGLIPALRHLCNECSTPHRVITFRENVPERLPPVIESSVFRICQEAVTNIVRHSGAETARVDLYVSDNQVHLMIQDDGVGMSVTTTELNGIGIINMRERAELLGGSFMIESSPDKGTDIIVEVPIL